MVCDISKELLEIMMVQDFQDFIGQVIKKMMVVILEVENQLFQVLLESVFDGEECDVMKCCMESVGSVICQEVGLVNGLQINVEGEDIVSNQDQVDSLLDELGFQVVCGSGFSL